MKHSNIPTLEKMYADFTRGDGKNLLTNCADKATFQVPGKSKLAGKYTKSSFQDFATKLRELSSGTHKTEVHDILASDQHGTVLLTESVMRSGQLVEVRMVHVWRFEMGIPVAGYAYPRDLYQFDALWS